MRAESLTTAIEKVETGLGQGSLLEQIGKRYPGWAEIKP